MINDTIKCEIIRTDTLKRPYRISDEDWDFCKDIKINICAKDSIFRDGRQKLGLSAFSRKEIFVDEEVGDYTLYHELGHVLAHLHNKEMSENKVFLENAYLLENKKFINTSVYGKNTYLYNFMEYIAQAYANCILYPFGYKRSYPYTYGALVKTGFIKDTCTYKLSYSLLNILLKMEIGDDYFYIKDLSPSFRARLCEALLHRNFPKEVQYVLNKYKEVHIQRMSRKFKLNKELIPV